MELLRQLVRLAPSNFDSKNHLLLLEKLMLLMQLKTAHDAGRYSEALALQEQIASRVEREETKSSGKPGKNTAEALEELASLALLAGEPKKALAACDRLLVLLPGDPRANINRAHALMYVDRTADARAAYEAHKADRLPDGKSWRQQVAEDFVDLRKAGREHPQMVVIEAALGATEKP
jgi:predicted Zn-dependent protease